MRILGIFLVSLVILLTWTPATTALACEFYARGLVNAPADVVSLADKFNDSLSRACINNEGKVLEYDSVTNIVHTQNGVCFYEWIVRVDAGEPAADEVHTFMASLPSSATCPPQGTLEYLQTDGISPGILVSILGFLKQVSGAPSDFERAILVEREREGLARPCLIEFRRSFLHESQNSRPLLRTIRLGRFLANEELLAFTLGFESGSNLGAGYEVAVDFMPDGWKVVDCLEVRVTR